MHNLRQVQQKIRSLIGEIDKSGLSVADTNFIITRLEAADEQIDNALHAELVQIKSRAARAMKRGMTLETLMAAIQEAETELKRGLW